LQFGFSLNEQLFYLLSDQKHKCIFLFSFSKFHNKICFNLFIEIKNFQKFKEEKIINILKIKKIMAYRFKGEQMLVEGALGALFTILVAIVVSTLISPILSSFSEATGFGMAVEAFFAALFLMFALKTHKGKENLPQDLVVILMILGFASIFSVFVPAMTLTYEMTITGIALLLSEAYLGLSVAKMFAKKVKL